MPKYYCDYCDTYLTHDSPSVRKTHNGGRKHKENVRLYYQQWMEEQAQKLVDATAKAFKEGKIPANPLGPYMRGPPGMGGAMIPPTPALAAANAAAAGMRPPMMPPGFPGGVVPMMPMGHPHPMAMMRMGMPMGIRPPMPQ